MSDKTSKDEVQSYVCIRVLIDGERERAVHVTSVPLGDYEALAEENAKLKGTLCHAGHPAIIHYDDECPLCVDSGETPTGTAKFKIGDDVIVDRWNAPAKVTGFLYKLEEPFAYPEDESALRSPKASATSETPDDWQPIETAPTNGKWVLLWWLGVTDCPIVGYRGHKGWCSPIGSWEGYLEGKTVGSPTHWRPLPNPPSMKTGSATDDPHSDQPVELNP
jgi:Protein of unknown function (DUF551)